MFEILESLNPFSSSPSSEIFDGAQTTGELKVERTNRIHWGVEALELIMQAIPEKPKEQLAQGIGVLAQREATVAHLNFDAPSYPAIQLDAKKPAINFPTNTLSRAEVKPKDQIIANNAPTQAQTLASDPTVKSTNGDYDMQAMLNEARAKIQDEPESQNIADGEDLLSKV